MPVVNAKQNYTLQNIEGANIFSVKGDGIGTGAWIGLIIISLIVGFAISIFSLFFAVVTSSLIIVIIIFFAVNKSSKTIFAIYKGNAFLYPNMSKINLVVMVILFPIFPVLGLLFLMGIWILRMRKCKRVFQNFTGSRGELDQYLGSEIGQIFVHDGNERFVAHRTGNTFVFGRGFIGLSGALSNGASQFGADITNMIRSSISARSCGVGFRHGAHDVYLVKNVRIGTAQQLAQDVASYLEKIE